MSEELIERRRSPPGGGGGVTWSDMDKHMDDKLEPIHEKLDNLLTVIKTIVPDGDFDGHRKYHEAKLLAAKEAEAAWKKRKEEVITWIVKGALVVIGLVFFAGLVSYFNAQVQEAVNQVDVPRAPAPTEARK